MEAEKDQGILLHLLGLRQQSKLQIEHSSLGARYVRLILVILYNSGRKYGR